MFRMTRDCLSLLCQEILLAIGESQFKSESYINTFLNNKGSMYHAHQISSDGVISGETKIVISLRLLAGGDSLDLAVIFQITPKHCQAIMMEILTEWVNGIQ